MNSNMKAHKERKIVEKDEVTTTQGSKRVNVTQVRQEGDCDSKYLVSNQATSQDNVHQGMQFLKEYWANISKIKESENRIFATLEK